MLEKIKAFLKLNNNIEDELLETLITAAKQLVKSVTGIEYNEADEIYKLLICYLAAHYYENRQVVGEKNMTQMPYTIQHLMAHIGVRGENEPGNI